MVFKKIGEHELPYFKLLSIFLIAIIENPMKINDQHPLYYWFQVQEYQRKKSKTTLLLICNDVFVFIV